MTPEPSMSASPVRSRLLSSFPTIRYGISSRAGGVSPEPYGMNLSLHVGDKRENVITNRGRFFIPLGIGLDRLAVPRQVHGDTARRVQEPGTYESCDALMTNKPELFLVVTVADCLPIFLFDPMTKSVAAVHAGWRGSKLRILDKALRGMSAEFGTKASDLIAYVGPSAGVCCYEVGEEVASEFDPEFKERQDGKKPHLDLKRFNKQLLLESGVSEESIEISEYCTICNPELFHSCRRGGEKSGRMMGVIGLLK